MYYNKIAWVLQRSYMKMPPEGIMGGRVNSGEILGLKQALSILEEAWKRREVWSWGQMLKVCLHCTILRSSEFILRTMEEYNGSGREMP